MYIITATGSLPTVTYTLTNAADIIHGLLEDEYSHGSIVSRILKDYETEDYTLWLIGRYEVRLYYKVVRG